MRVALHSVLREGAVDDYREHHARIPDDLAALFGEVGIRDWTIWRSGAHLFHLVECDDFPRAMDLIGRDPADQRWQADIGRFVDRFEGPDGEPTTAPMERIWSLGSQRGA